METFKSIEDQWGKHEEYNSGLDAFHLQVKFIQNLTAEVAINFAMWLAINNYKPIKTIWWDSKNPDERWFLNTLTDDTIEAKTVFMLFEKEMYNGTL